jgi:mevalonate kinase
MSLIVSAPSKTFLIGEYAVLNSSTALLLNTKPRFELEATRGSGKISGIPKGSPAWQWLEYRSPLLNDWDLKFHDPHLGAGGFGASGAQFLLSHSFTTFLQRGSLRGPDLQAAWSDQQVLSDAKGSGADVIAQATGQVALVDCKSVSAEALSWPYVSLDFSIFKTAAKVFTHEHLEKFKRELNSDLGRTRQQLEELSALTQACVENFRAENAEASFLKSFREFGQALRRFDLQAPETVKQLETLETKEWCLGAKGCGALGADTLLVIHEKARGTEVREFLRQNGLKYIASAEHLSSGLEVQLREESGELDRKLTYEPTIAAGTP